jgi:hypothetical protein
MSGIEMANRGDYTPINTDDDYDLTYKPSVNVEPTVLPSSVTAASGGQCANLPDFLFGDPIPAETEYQREYETIKFNLGMMKAKIPKGVISDMTRSSNNILDNIYRLISQRIITPEQGEIAKTNISKLLACVTSLAGGRKRTRRSGRKANKKTQRKQKKRTSKNIKKQKKRRMTSKR